MVYFRGLNRSEGEEIQFYRLGVVLNQKEL